MKSLEGVIVQSVFSLASQVSNYVRKPAHEKSKEDRDDLIGKSIVLLVGTLAVVGVSKVLDNDTKKLN